MLVVVELASGPRRFRQLQRAVDGISQRMLTLTVRRLERDGLVTRTVYPTVPPMVDYRLTGTGASLTHLVKALADWSLRHRDDIALARHAYDAEHPATTSADGADDHVPPCQRTRSRSRREWPRHGIMRRRRRSATRSARSARMARVST